MDCDFEEEDIWGGLNNDDILASDSYEAGTTHHKCMELLDREVTPVLALLMTLPPKNDHHPDVMWLYNWLIHSKCSVEEFKHVIGPLQESVRQIMMQLFKQYTYDSNAIYMARIAAEALAARCPVLVGPWEQVAWYVVHLFNYYRGFKHQQYGSLSNSLITWIIHVVGDPDICPNPDLRIEMLLLYKIVVETDNDNREQALKSLMSAYSSLDRNRQSFIVLEEDDVTDCLMGFLENNYINQFAQKIAEKMKKHRKKRQEILLHDTSHDYSIGLKKCTEPRELQGLIALFQFICDGALIDYNAFQEEPYNMIHVDNVEDVSCKLHFFFYEFQMALKEPEFRIVIVESIMDVMEAMVMVTWGKLNVENITFSGPIPQEEYDFYYFDTFLKHIFDNEDDNCNPITQEIIRRYKTRICKMRKIISFEFLEHARTISRILYNSQY